MEQNNEQIIKPYNLPLKKIIYNGKEYFIDKKETFDVPLNIIGSEKTKNRLYEAYENRNGQKSANEIVEIIEEEKIESYERDLNADQFQIYPNNKNYIYSEEYNEEKYQNEFELINLPAHLNYANQNKNYIHDPLYNLNYREIYIGEELKRFYVKPPKIKNSSHKNKNININNDNNNYQFYKNNSQDKNNNFNHNYQNNNNQNNYKRKIPFDNNNNNFKRKNNSENYYNKNHQNNFQYKNSNKNNNNFKINNDPFFKDIKLILKDKKINNNRINNENKSEEESEVVNIYKRYDYFDTESISDSNSQNYDNEKSQKIIELKEEENSQKENSLNDIDIIIENKDNIENLESFPNENLNLLNEHFLKNISRERRNRLKEEKKKDIEIISLDEKDEISQSENIINNTKPEQLLNNSENKINSPENKNISEITGKEEDIIINLEEKESNNKNKIFNNNKNSFKDKDNSNNDLKTKEGELIVLLDDNDENKIDMNGTDKKESALKPEEKLLTNENLSNENNKDPIILIDTDEDEIKNKEISNIENNEIKKDIEINTEQKTSYDIFNINKNIQNEINNIQNINKNEGNKENKINNSYPNNNINKQINKMDIEEINDKSILTSEINGNISNPESTDYSTTNNNNIQNKNNISENNKSDISAENNSDKNTKKLEDDKLEIIKPNNINSDIKGNIDSGNRKNSDNKISKNSSINQFESNNYSDIDIIYRDDNKNKINKTENNNIVISDKNNSREKIKIYKYDFSKKYKNEGKTITTTLSNCDIELYPFYDIEYVRLDNKTLKSYQKKNLYYNYLLKLKRLKINIDKNKLEDNNNIKFTETFIKEIKTLLKENKIKECKKLFKSKNIDFKRIEDFCIDTNNNIYNLNNINEYFPNVYKENPLFIFKFDLLTGVQKETADGNWAYYMEFIFVKRGFYNFYESTKSENLSSEFIQLNRYQKELHSITNTVFSYTINNKKCFITYICVIFKKKHIIKRSTFPDWLMLDKSEEKIKFIRSGNYGNGNTEINNTIYYDDFHDINLDRVILKHCQGLKGYGKYEDQ